MLLLFVLGLVGAAASQAEIPPAWIDAVEHDRIQQIGTLLARAENVDRRTRTGKTALMAAARRGDHGLAKRLIDAGANVEAANRGGGTPLLYAAWNGEPHTIELLLTEGARVNHQSNNGWTALMMAAAKNHAPAARLLLASGAEPNLTDIYDWTPLMRAGYAGHIEIVEILLRSPKTDVYVLNDQGQSALHLAVVSDDEEVVRLLLEAGAPAGVVDAQGHTAMAIAEAMERPRLIQLLGHATP